MENYIKSERPTSKDNRIRPCSIQLERASVDLIRSWGPKHDTTLENLPNLRMLLHESDKKKGSILQALEQDENSESLGSMDCGNQLRILLCGSDNENETILQTLEQDENAVSLGSVDCEKKAIQTLYQEGGSSTSAAGENPVTHMEIEWKDQIPSAQNYQSSHLAHIKTEQTSLGNLEGKEQSSDCNGTPVFLQRLHVKIENIFSCSQNEQDLNPSQEMIVNGTEKSPCLEKVGSSSQLESTLLFQNMDENTTDILGQQTGTCTTIHERGLTSYPTVRKLLNGSCTDEKAHVTGCKGISEDDDNAGNEDSTTEDTTEHAEDHEDLPPIAEVHEALPKKKNSTSEVLKNLLVHSIAEVHNDLPSEENTTSEDTSEIPEDLPVLSSNHDEARRLRTRRKRIHYKFSDSEDEEENKDEDDSQWEENDDSEDTSDEEFIPTKKKSVLTSGNEDDRRKATSEGSQSKTTGTVMKETSDSVKIVPKNTVLFIQKNPGGNHDEGGWLVWKSNNPGNPGGNQTTVPALYWNLNNQGNPFGNQNAPIVLNWNLTNVQGNPVGNLNTQETPPQNQNHPLTSFGNRSLLGNPPVVQNNMGHPARNQTTDTCKTLLASKKNSGHSMIHHISQGYIARKQNNQGNPVEHAGLEGNLNDMGHLTPHDEMDIESSQDTIISSSDEDANENINDKNFKYIFGEEGTFERLNNKHLFTPLCVQDNSEAFDKVFDYVEWNCQMRCIFCMREFDLFSDYLLHCFGDNECHRQIRTKQIGRRHTKNHSKNQCKPCSKFSLSKSGVVHHMLKAKSHGPLMAACGPKKNHLVDKQKQRESQERCNAKEDVIENIDTEKESTLVEKDGPKGEGSVTDTKHTCSLDGNPSCNKKSRNSREEEGKKQDEESVVDLETLQDFQPGYQCKVCGNKASVMSSLSHALKHIKSVHTREEWRTLTYRKVVYTKRGKKKVLRQESQRNIQTYLCEVCGREYKTKDALVTHIGTYHKDISLEEMGFEIPRAPFLCPHCGKQFPAFSRHEFNRHLTRHTDPVTCEICGNVLKNRQGYLIHKRSLHSEKKYTCEECGKEFKNMNCFATHKRMHRRWVEGKRFVCDLCGKEFVFKHHLKNHENTVHSSIRNFACSCGKAFKMAHHLRNHSKICKGPSEKEESD